MALVGRRDGRNFGYGKQLSYAGPLALKDMFGGGHYGTVKAHSDRWLAFVRWCRSEQGPGINDARQIGREVLAKYAAYLRDTVSRGRGFGKENMIYIRRRYEATKYYYVRTVRLLARRLERSWVFTL